MSSLQCFNPFLQDGEIWKDVAGFEGLYMVSNKGRVWSVPRLNRNRAFGGHLIRIGIDKRNRCVVALSKNGKNRTFIPARLVATAFIRDPNSGEEVNHLDENPLNNCVENLEWCSHKYNCNYGTRIKRIKDKQSIPILQYTLEGEFVAEYASMHIAADAVKAEAGHICDCCIGNRKWAYGFFWRYKDDALYEEAKSRIEKKTAASRKSRADKFTAKALNVVQLDLQGNYIRTFQSSRLAAESANTHRPLVINCCNGKAGSAGGYKWIYEKDFRKMFIEREPDAAKGCVQQLTFF